MSRPRGSTTYPGLTPGTPEYKRASNLAKLARRRERQWTSTCAVCTRIYAIDSTAERLSGRKELVCSQTCRERLRRPG